MVALPIAAPTVPCAAPAASVVEPGGAVDPRGARIGIEADVQQPAVGLQRALRGTVTPVVTCAPPKPGTLASFCASGRPVARRSADRYRAVSSHPGAVVNSSMP